MTDELERYIREHRATYTREALTKELIDAGHDPSAISAAWASVEAGDQSTGEPPPAVAPVGWGDGGGAAPAGGPTAPAGPPGVGVGTVLLLIGLTLAYAAAAMASLAAFSYNPLVFGLYIIGMIAAGIWSGRRIARASSRGEGVAAIGVGLALSVGLFVGLSGLCIVGLSNTTTTIY